MAESSARKPRWRTIGLFGALILVQLVAFQNCGSDFVVKDGLDSASGSGNLAVLEADFESSYYPFLKTNCTACHTGNGPGQGAFASTDPDVAYNAFLLATSNGSDTASKLDANATNTAHAGASYTGPQNSSADTLASQQWAAALAGANAGGGSTGPEYITTSKVMSATTTDKDISWAVATDLASGSGSSLGGATLTIAVHEATSPNGSPVYYFSNPRIKGGTKSITITGLMIRINGQEQTLGSTWSRVSATAAAGATVQLSAATLILEYDASTAADTLSVSIDSMSAQ